MDAGTLALVASGDFDDHWLFQVANGSGTLKDVSARVSAHSLTLPNPDAPISSLSLTFVRELLGPGDSLAPFMGASALNRLDDGTTYSPLLEVGRVVVASVALTARGAARPATGYREVFRGRLSGDSWPGHYGDISLTALDQSGRFQKEAMEADLLIPAGTSIEAAMQTVLTTRYGAGAYTLSTPVATGQVLSVDYRAGKQKKVQDVLWGLAQSIGWVVWWRYGADNVARLTLFEPQRAKSTSDFTFPKVRDLTHLEVNEEQISNVLFGEYTDPAGVRQPVGPVEDAVSITKYGGVRRASWISEEPDSPVKSDADMLLILNAALSDMSDPDAVQVAEVAPLPFGECAVDLYTFAADGVHYDSAQQLAPYSITVTGRAHALSSSAVSVRGRPSGGYRSWAGRRADNPPPEASPRVAVTVRETATVGTCVVTVESDPSARVSEVEFYATDAAGVRTGPHASTSTASAGVYERDITLDPDHNVKLEPFVVLTDGSRLSFGSETFDVGRVPAVASAVTVNQGPVATVLVEGDSDTTGLYYKEVVGGIEQAAVIFAPLPGGRKGSFAAPRRRGGRRTYHVYPFNAEREGPFREVQVDTYDGPPVLVGVAVRETDTVGTCVVTVVDPLALVTAIEFYATDAAGVRTGPHAAIRTPGPQPLYTSVQELDITLHPEHNVKIEPVVKLSDGSPPIEPGAETFDRDRNANVIPGPVSYDGKNASIPVRGDSDTTVLYAEEWNGSAWVNLVLIAYGRGGTYEVEASTAGKRRFRTWGRNAAGVDGPKVEVEVNRYEDPTQSTQAPTHAHYPTDATQTLWQLDAVLGVGGTGPIQARVETITGGLVKDWTNLPFQQAVPRVARDATEYVVKIRDAAGRSPSPDRIWTDPILPGLGTGGRVNPAEPLEGSTRTPGQIDTDSRVGPELVDPNNARKLPPTELAAGSLPSTLAVGSGILLTTVSGAIGANAENRIKNPNGTDGATGAQAPGWTQSGGNPLTPVSDGTRLGGRSLQIHNPTGANSFSSQTAAVVAGEYWELSGWITTPEVGVAGGQAVLNLDGGSPVVLRADAPYVNGPDIGLPVDSARPWTYVRCVMRMTVTGTVTLYAQLGYLPSAVARAKFHGITFKRISEWEASNIEETMAAPGLLKPTVTVKEPSVSLNIMRGMKAGECEDATNNANGVAFSPAFERTPVVVFGSGGITGKSGIAEPTITDRALNLSASGFTPSLKISALPGTLTARSSDAFVGTDANKPQVAEAHDLTYRFNFSVTLGAYEYVDMQFWTDNGGGWVSRASRSYSNDLNAPVTYAEYVDVTVAGMGAGSDFRITAIGPAGNYAMTRDPVTWSEGAAATQHSRTPAGASKVSYIAAAGS